MILEERATNIRDRQLTAMACPLVDSDEPIDHLRVVERWDRLHVAVSVLAVDN